MSLFNGATSKQQKPQLPNPFDLTDSRILEIAFPTHLYGDDKCDVEVLLNIVSNLVLKTGLAEVKASLTGLQPEFSTMKLISCQMISTARGDERYVHETTMHILEHLETYSWDAKALLTVGAFALKCRNVLHLSGVATSDQLVAQWWKQTREGPATELEVFVMQVLHDIREWARWSGLGYDILEVPSLTDAQQEVPVVVYWTLASLVAATTNLLGVSYST